MKPLPLLFLALALAGQLPAHPDPTHTLAEIEENLAARPHDPDLLLHKARLLLRTGHPDAALPIARKALEFAPRNPDILLLHALLSEALENPAEALARTLQVTRSYPDFHEAWGVLARLQHEAGRPDEAIAAKLRHLESPEHLGPGDFLTVSGWLRDRGHLGDEEAAIAILDRAIVKFGPLTGLQQSAIRIECSLSRHEAALARVNILVAKHRPSVFFSLLRADIFESSGRHAEAATACDAALALLDATRDPGLSSTRQKIIARKESNLKKSAPAPSPAHSS